MITERILQQGPAGTRLVEAPQAYPWSLLSELAWEVRERAHLYARRAVGAAVLDQNGWIHVGCNVEQRYRSHDIHAETNALSSMVAAGGRGAQVCLVVAESAGLYSCGACLDFVLQLGGPDCMMGFQWVAEGPIEQHRAGAMLPFCPQ